MRMDLDIMLCGTLLRSMAPGIIVFQLIDEPIRCSLAYALVPFNITHEARASHKYILLFFEIFLAFVFDQFLPDFWKFLDGNRIQQPFSIRSAQPIDQFAEPSVNRVYWQELFRHTIFSFFPIVFGKLSWEKRSRTLRMDRYFLYLCAAISVDVGLVMHNKISILWCEFLKDMIDVQTNVCIILFH